MNARIHSTLTDLTVYAYEATRLKKPLPSEGFKTNPISRQNTSDVSHDQIKQ
jgi:hypothetical protein